MGLGGTAGKVTQPRAWLPCGWKVWPPLGWIASAFSVCACVLAIGFEGRAETYLLKPDGFGDLPTIQAALDIAVEGDSVILADGEFTIGTYLRFPAGNIVFCSQSGDPSRCGISSEGDREALNFSHGQSSATVLEGITIRDAADWEGFGGGALCYGASPTIRRCVFRNNLAVFGGGVACYNASPTIEDCLFEDNWARGTELSGWGGGISVGHGAPRIIDCTFRRNSTFGTGAGVDIQGGSAQIVDCRFLGGDGLGGGIFCSSGQAEIVGCVITGNRASGVLCNGASVTIRNTTIAGCAGGSRGGGGVLVMRGGHLSAERCVIWGNCSDAGFGNVQVDPEGTATFECCLVESAGVGGGGTIEGLGSDSFRDPLFCGPTRCSSAPTDEGNYRVSEFSPCTPAWSPCGDWIGAVELICTPQAPSLGIRSVSPSPFSARTVIAFELPRAAGGSLRIYDVAGRLQRTVWQGTLPAGVHQTTWDGLGENTQRLPAGIYLMRLETDGRMARVRKVVLAR